MSKTLDQVRTEIDKIDNSVHDLLMQRADLVSSVAQAKRDQGVFGVKIVHPAREAKMIRRLLGRHHGPLPKATVVYIWRELVGSVALMQTGLSVVVTSEDSANPYWDMAKNYFGSVVPMTKLKGDQNVLSSLCEDKYSFGVLPWPELNESKPWWQQLFNQQREDRLNIICALPFGQDMRKGVGNGDRALVVSKGLFKPSDDDISFIGLTLDQQISRAKILDFAQEAGFEILNLYSVNTVQGGGCNSHMLEVEGYIEQDDKALETLENLFAVQCQYIRVLGGYPAVPDIYDENLTIA